jgi:16S rRNA (guanine966-N2)-methyltransferase
MTDKIKGAVFNALLSLGVEPVRVLDLYAGTGSLGIEALSRGAISADFVDMGREQCETIRANIEGTGFAKQGTVHRMAVDDFLKRPSTPYDLIILDPPYADPQILPTLTAVAGSSLVQSRTIVVIGHSPRVALLDRLRLRCHGDSCFSIYEADSAGDT